MTWREEIVMARERRALGQEPAFDLDARCKAGSWSTCAVGEQHALHPETVVYVPSTTLSGAIPLDARLRTYGSAVSGFTFAVLVQDDPDLAEHFLDMIEDRVLALKRGA